MKIKGSLKNLSAKKIIIMFSCFGALFLALRAYQAAFAIDSDTGFFAVNSSFSTALFFALAALLALITPVLLYLTPLPSKNIKPKKNDFHALMNLALALAAAYNSYALMRTSDGAKTALPLIVCGAAASVVLLTDAAGFFLNNEIIQRLKLLNLIPVLWALLLTVKNFSVTVSYLNNTVMLVNIFADAFFMLFLFEYAKKISGINGEGNSVSFIYAALMSALLELSSFITSVIGIIGSSDADILASIMPYRLFAALFCASALAMLLKREHERRYRKLPEFEVEIETVSFDPMPRPESDKSNEF